MKGKRSVNERAANALLDMLLIPDKWTERTPHEGWLTAPEIYRKGTPFYECYTTSQRTRRVVRDTSAYIEKRGYQAIEKLEEKGLLEARKRTRGQGLKVNGVKTSGYRIKKALLLGFYGAFKPWGRNNVTAEKEALLEAGLLAAARKEWFLNYAANPRRFEWRVRQVSAFLCDLLNTSQAQSDFLLGTAAIDALITQEATKERALEKGEYLKILATAIRNLRSEFKKQDRLMRKADDGNTP